MSKIISECSDVRSRSDFSRVSCIVVGRPRAKSVAAGSRATPEYFWRAGAQPDSSPVKRFTAVAAVRGREKNRNSKTRVNPSGTHEESSRRPGTWIPSGDSRSTSSGKWHRFPSLRASTQVVFRSKGSDSAPGKAPSQEATKSSTASKTDEEYCNVGFLVKREMDLLILISAASIVAVAAILVAVPFVK